MGKWQINSDQEHTILLRKSISQRTKSLILSFGRRYAAKHPKRFDGLREHARNLVCLFERCCVLFTVHNRIKTDYVHTNIFIVEYQSHNQFSDYSIISYTWIVLNFLKMLKNPKQLRINKKMGFLIGQPQTLAHSVVGIYFMHLKDARIGHRCSFMFCILSSVIFLNLTCNIHIPGQNSKTIICPISPSWKNSSFI